MKKFAFLSMLMLAVAMTATAKSVVFVLSDNTLVYYLLGGETNPIMRFVDGGVTVNDDKYEFSGIKHFYISNTDDPNGIDTVTSQPEASFRGNKLVVKGENASVTVSKIDGTRVSADVEKANGCVSVDLSGLSSGNYIIKVGASSFKVNKK